MQETGFAGGMGRRGFIKGPTTSVLVALLTRTAEVSSSNSSRIEGFESCGQLARWKIRQAVLHE